MKDVIRRCLNCRYKTHRRFWKNEVCPVCEIQSAYVESWHGGLGENDIIIARKKLERTIHQIEGKTSLTSPQKERHY